MKLFIFLSTFCFFFFNDVHLFVDTVHPWHHWLEKLDRIWWRETQLGSQIPRRLLTCTTIMSVLPPLLSATMLWNLLMSSTISPQLVLTFSKPSYLTFLWLWWYDYVIFFYYSHYGLIVSFVCYIRLGRVLLSN